MSAMNRKAKAKRQRLSCFYFEWDSFCLTWGSF